MADFISDKPETVIGLFSKRGYYKYIAFKSHAHENIIDFNNAEKYLYGRVNRFYVPIVPRFSRDPNTLTGPFRRFDPELSQKSLNSAHSFVVDAFEDLAQQFKKSSFSGKIDTTHPFLSNLQIYKTYEDPFKLYDDYLNDYFSSLAAEFKAQQIKVKNFDDFTQHLIPLLENSLSQYAFTVSGYIKSRHAPVTCSGLVIEIADLSPSNDEEKTKQFWESKNWDFFVNACSNYGFMVDQFIPWRLVADIGGPVMTEYAAKYGMGTTDGILNYAFETPHDEGYARFKYILLRLYNRIKLDKFIQRESRALAAGPPICDIVTKIVYPETYTKEQLVKKYPEEYFLKLYCKMRFLEEETNFKEAEQNILIDDCVELAIGSDISEALLVFERILNKPFDYRGSMSYINKHIQAVENDISND